MIEKIQTTNQNLTDFIQDNTSMVFSTLENVLDVPRKSGPVSSLKANTLENQKLDSQEFIVDSDEFMLLVIHNNPQFNILDFDLNIEYLTEDFLESEEPEAGDESLPETEESSDLKSIENLDKEEIKKRDLENFKTAHTESNDLLLNSETVCRQAEDSEVSNIIQLTKSTGVIPSHQLFSLPNQFLPQDAHCERIFQISDEKKFLKLTLQDINISDDRLNKVYNLVDPSSIKEIEEMKFGSDRTDHLSSTSCKTSGSNFLEISNYIQPETKNTTQKSHNHTTNSTYLLCENNLPTKYLFFSNSIKIKFKSNSWNKSLGFLIKYQVIDESELKQHMHSLHSLSPPSKLVSNLQEPSQSTVLDSDQQTENSQKSVLDVISEKIKFFYFDGVSKLGNDEENLAPAANITIAEDDTLIDDFQAGYDENDQDLGLSQEIEQYDLDEVPRAELLKADFTPQALKSKKKYNRIVIPSKLSIFHIIVGAGLLFISIFCIKTAYQRVILQNKQQQQQILSLQKQITRTEENIDFLNQTRQNSRKVSQECIVNAPNLNDLESTHSGEILCLKISSS